MPFPIRPVLAFGCLLGCLPKVHLTVLDSADLVLSPELRTITIADRTGVPEGAAAVAGFTRWMSGSPRFDLVDAAADVTVVVDGFEGESSLAVEEHATIRSSSVVLTWRLTDRAGTVLDALEHAATTDRWVVAGDDPVPTAEETISALAESSGVAYARRLIAVDSTLVRDTFVRGDPRLRFARVAVNAGDWRRAIALWSDVARSEDPALAARAHYDLAVGYEVGGDVRRALAHVDQAAALDDGARIARYKDLLDRANRDQRPLRPLAQPPSVQEE